MKRLVFLASMTFCSLTAFGQQQEAAPPSGEGSKPETIIVEGERWPGAGGAGSTGPLLPGTVIGSGPQGSNGGGSKGPKIGNDNSNGEECKNERIRNGALCGYEIWGTEFSVGKHAIFFVCRKDGKVVRSNFVNCE